MGNFVITMDGDLQDDPKEIPRFLEKLKEFDMVSGWKVNRQDPVSKTFPSKFFNRLTRFITGININDFNCGYKGYKRKVVKNIKLYGEFHRYIPVLAHWKGYTIGEIEVEHHPRIHGKSNLGHFGATSIEWIPFCALYLMKMFKEGGIRNSFFAGIFFILVAMSDLQYMEFMGIFVMLLFVYEIYIFLKNDKTDYKERLKKIFYKYTLFGVISLLGLIPLSLENILIATSKENFLKLDPFEAVTYSADLLSFFLPSVLHPVFGSAQIFTKIFQENTGENTAFIGYAVILFSSFAILRLRGNRYVKFWSISALFFSLISLGPLLHVNGNTSFTVFNTTVPLPYLALYYLVPFLDNCRTSGRFFVIASLSFAVLRACKIIHDFKR